MKRVIAATLMLTLVITTGAPIRSALSQTQPAAAPPLPWESKLLRSEHAIPGRYIVVLDDAVQAEAIEPLAHDLARVFVGRVLHVYTDAIKGFAVEMAEFNAEALSYQPLVSYVVEDAEGSGDGQATGSQAAQQQADDESEDGLVSAQSVQEGVWWGLDRIDERQRPLDGSFNYRSTGRGVRLYVLDSGVRITHSEFGGRAVVGFDAVDDDNDPDTDSNTDGRGRDGLDCHGHGTNVASIAAGRTYGVAKEVRVRSVRVLRCNNRGSVSDFIAGVNWVTRHGVRPAVVNMSLVAPAHPALDAAVRRSIARGFTYVVCAGNDGRDARRTSPARVEQAITVGATDRNDARADFAPPLVASNFGPALDLFAPGLDIRGASHRNDRATADFSGTSQAAPHVAGAAAMYLQRNPAARPDRVELVLVRRATRGVVRRPGQGSPNLLLYTRGL